MSTQYTLDDAFLMAIGRPADGASQEEIENVIAYYAHNPGLPQADALEGLNLVEIEMAIETCFDIETQSDVSAQFTRRINREIQRWIDRLPWRRKDKEDADAPTPPPPPPPPPQITNYVNPDVISIWCEASGAYDRGIRNATVWALTGKAGAANIRIAHPWYHPWRSPISRAEWVRRLQAAKNEGCIAFGIDTEGWIFQRHVCDDIWAARQEVDIPVLHVPKATVGLGPQPPHKWLTGSFESDVKYLETVSDGCWLWNYGYDGEGYRMITNLWRRAGYTKQIGWIQDQVRNANGFHGARLWEHTVQTAREHNTSFMLFLGNHSSNDLIARLRSYY